ncbi:MAG: amino acid ABC transporter substrate-binding protein [Burkholderiales bacterium]|jgi:ABC-type amino acid transport substrate-binding protein
MIRTPVRILSTVLLGIALAAPVLVRAAPPADTIERVTRTGTLIVGYRADSAPFSFDGPDGRPAGYSVALCRQVAESLKTRLKLPRLEVKWVPVTVASRIASVENGTVDLECGSTTRTLSRMERVDFSLPIFIEGSSFITLASSGLKNGRDLAGKRVGVIPGTTTETMLKAAQGKDGFSGVLVPVKTHDEGVAALADGRIDAYVSDRTILVGMARASGRAGTAWQLSDDFFSLETYGLMMRRDARFRVEVDRALSDLYRSGRVIDLFGAAFGTNVPLPPALQAMYLQNALPE